MEKISGYIEHIIFSNADNGYTVFELTTDTEEITCVGALHAVSSGESVVLTGQYVSHPVYGRQFSFDSYEVSAAEDETSVLRYLSSGAVKGIGPALAMRIVKAFGTDTFRIMEEEPEMLASVKGISLRKAQEIGANVTEKQDIRKVMLFLQKFGISNNLASKIHKKYGNEIFDVMRQDPYRIAEDIEGVGFRTADEMARSSGVAVDAACRVKSGIRYALSLAVSEGHIYIPLEKLIEDAAQLLEVDSEYVRSECENLAMEKKVMIKRGAEGPRVYQPRLYNMEISCARMLLDLDVLLDPNESRIRTEITKLEKADTPLDDKQKDAVVAAIGSGVSVITGGPGTGKTTIIETLIRYLVSRGEDFVLCAPTGRAAKRMTEATGYESYTIQRLLGLTPGKEPGSRYSYQHNEEDPLETDTIIVDEMSMVDLPLFYALLSALIPGTRLIMVGDTDQLPPVGPGSVLKDMIASGCFKVTFLDRIFRQTDTSDIVINAHRINSGKMPKLDNKSRDFFMLRRNDIDLILNNIVVLVNEKLPGYVHAKPFDIQVLTPMRKGPLGTKSLNPILQRYINPPAPGKKEKTIGSTLYREGDKVMQIRNNYQLEWEVVGRYGIVADKGLGVFNGDMGTIRSIDSFSEIMEVIYEDDHLIRYPFSNLDELELAYAVTIHKSQGSEYPAVVIPILSGPKQLFTRNLLYTAVTRAVKCVTIVGSENTIQQMVDNEDELKRFTSLNEALIDISSL
ncbi:MAG: ATP-dependent RecD-like DNA helicase [Lachnospiraceae bacterium]|nr:ATP-dependent RecD-like DNA helicase [Lachnospiraceae bacterium]